MIELRFEFNIKNIKHHGDEKKIVETDNLSRIAPRTISVGI
jgi:hypothetical protein